MSNTQYFYQNTLSKDKVQVIVPLYDIERYKTLKDLLHMTLQNGS